MSPVSYRPLALVTGACAGIGLEIARQLAALGHDIVDVGSSDKIDRLPELVPSTTVHPVRVDLRTREGVDQAWAAVESLERPLAVAALNAGRSLGGAFVHTDIEDELNLIALNITSQVLLAKHVVQRMAHQRSGRIFMTSSLSATTPDPLRVDLGKDHVVGGDFATSAPPCATASCPTRPRPAASLAQAVPTPEARRAG